MDGQRESRTVVKMRTDPDTDPVGAREIHLNAVAGGIYSGAMQHRFRRMFQGFDLTPSAMVYAQDMIERMAPRDPMEEMLVVQALMAHARVLHLTDLANRQERLENLRTVHEYADRASNTFRRLMCALADYRKPPRGGDSFTAIKQANIAGQQVVMNAENSGANATNEQGSSDAASAPPEPQASQAALPTEPGGAGVAAGLSGAEHAVDTVDRAEDR
ncbi:MAG: hypothetical protein AAGI30_13975 [Planctomycetota bacterium]